MLVLTENIMYFDLIHMDTELSYSSGFICYERRVLASAAATVACFFCAHPYRETFWGKSTLSFEHLSHVDMVPKVFFYHFLNLKWRTTLCSPSPLHVFWDRNCYQWVRAKTGAVAQCNSSVLGTNGPIILIMYELTILISLYHLLNKHFVSQLVVKQYSLAKSIFILRLGEWIS